MRYTEINFDGLVGPTHNYAGLSTGNLASQASTGKCSNPRAAALQGLAKAWALASRGFPQAILPPHERPAVDALRAWGFSGLDDGEVLAAAARAAPHLLAAACSASAMWTANACTMSPSCDTADGRAHFTPANLHAKLHRSIEAAFTRTILQRIFADEERFAVHPPLAGGDAMADEGAANHTRLCGGPAAPGLHLFVFGRSAFQQDLPRPRRHPARQTREAGEAIARCHGLGAGRAVFLQQSPAAIDAGVFHNDVICVGHRDLLLVHEQAFVDQPAALAGLQAAFARLAGAPLRILQVPRARVSLRQAVRTYLFNSQLLDLPDGKFLLVVPAECRRSSAVRTLLEEFVQDPGNPIAEVLAFDLRESMRNGGGPACLRQRIVLNANELRHLKGNILLDQPLYAELTAWINRHYRERLEPGDLADPRLLEESRRALDELTRILHLPGLYAFQR